MRHDTLLAAAVMASITPAMAQWWGGAPECAQSCLSSAFPTTTTDMPTTATAPNANWPAQSSFCQTTRAAQINACLQSACTSTLFSAIASYTSLSSSLCSRYESCVASVGSLGASGADAVVTTTVTYPGGAVSWAAPGGGGGGGVGGVGGGSVAGPWWKRAASAPNNNDNDNINNNNNPGAGGQGPFLGSSLDPAQASSYFSAWTSAASWSAGAGAPGGSGGTPTWAGATVTVTGSPGEVCNYNSFAGSPWFLGPGCGWNEAGGFNGWVGWGSGWSWGPTSTKTITQVFSTTATGASAGGAGGSGVRTETQLATVVMAVSGSYTTESTIAAQAQETGGSSGGGQGDTGSGAVAGAGGADGMREGSVVPRMAALALATVVLLAGLL